MPEHAGLAQAVTDLTSLDSTPYSLAASPRSSLPPRQHSSSATTTQNGATTRATEFGGNLMANRTNLTGGATGAGAGGTRDERYYSQEHEQAWSNHQLRQSHSLPLLLSLSDSLQRSLTQRNDSSTQERLLRPIEPFLTLPSTTSSLLRPNPTHPALRIAYRPYHRNGRYRTRSREDEF